MADNTDPQSGKVEAPIDPTGEGEQKADGQMDQLATKTKAILGDAADWATDQLKNVSDRFNRPDASDDVPQTGVAHRPPAPVTGDEGARAAGKVEDDIT